jgi:Domain of unknown function (DUF4333)
MPGTTGPRATGRALLMVVVGLTVAGCSTSASIGSASIGSATPAAPSATASPSAPVTAKKADVEKQVSDQLARKVGQTPKSVTCPGDLAAQTGTTMRCILTADDGTAFGVTITVTAVDTSTGNVGLDMKVDNTPITSPTT